MRTPLITLSLVAAALSLAACGGADKIGTATGAGGGSTAANGAVAHPTGATDVVLQISTGGGFVAPATNLRQLPSFTLYGDGTVITPAAVAEIFPGPAIAPLTVSHLDEAQVQVLLKAAKDAGLLVGGPIDFGDMGSVGIADAPTTTVRIAADGTTVRLDAYALSMDPAGGGQMPAGQVKARAALATFVAGAKEGADAKPYTPAGVAVYVGAFQGEAQAGAAPVVWPLSSDLATAGSKTADGLDLRCLAVTGDDAATLLAALAKANEQTQWTARADTNATFAIVARPLLPGETGCAAPGA
jgi:hypothetical protein